LAVERKRSKEPEDAFMENSSIGNANTLNRAIEDIVVATISSNQGMAPTTIRIKAGLSKVDSDDRGPATFDSEFFKKVFMREKQRVKLNLFDERANVTRIRVESEQIWIAPQVVQKVSNLTPRGGESIRLKKLEEKLIICEMKQNRASDLADIRLLNSGK
ncbi:MAG: hypothetical protein GVY26_00310, partial [Bacteroidetes bacterium]|nr:hypothetical protein [Bacteroidota bacterium]